MNSAEVILFQDDERSLNYRHLLPYKLNSIAIKSVDYDLEDLKKSGISFIGGVPRNNTTFFLHPYKNTVYVHESQGEMYFLKEKIELFIRFGRLLGAKSIETSIEKIEVGKMETNAKGELEYKVVKVDFGAEALKENKNYEAVVIKETIQLESHFDINKNIQDLRNFIDKYNLGHEIDLVSLIDARDSSKTGSRLIHKTLKSELSSEYTSLLSVSAGLNSPIFSVSGGFSRRFESVNKILINITYDFGDN